MVMRPVTVVVDRAEIYGANLCGHRRNRLEHVEVFAGAALRSSLLLLWRRCWRWLWHLSWCLWWRVGLLPQRNGLSGLASARLRLGLHFSGLVGRWFRWLFGRWFRRLFGRRE
jgi:hypothetical protein